MSTTTMSLRMAFTSVNHMQHAVPPGSREEVCEHRHKAFEGASGRFVLVVLAPGLVRPVDQERFSFDVVAAQKSPVAAVLRVVAIVAHHEILVGRNGHR